MSREEYIEQGGDPELLELLAHDEVVQRVLEDLRQTAEALRDPMRSQPRPEERQAMRQGVEEMITYLETHLQRNHHSLIQTLVSMVLSSPHELYPEQLTILRLLIRSSQNTRNTNLDDFFIRVSSRLESQTNPPEIDDLPIEPCPGIELLIGGVLGLGLRGLTALGGGTIGAMGGTSVVTQIKRLPQTSKDVARYFRNQSLQRKQAKIRQKFARRDNVTTEQAQTVGFIGRNPRDPSIENNFLIGNTELTGGLRGAENLYARLRNELPTQHGNIVRNNETLFNNRGADIGKFSTFSNGSRVQMRYQGSSGDPKVDIIDIVKMIEEKITFLP